jgi:dihydropteroate synthase
MDSLNEYQDIARDVAAELSVQVEAAIAAGVKRENIVIDPGARLRKRHATKLETRCSSG